MKSDRNTNQCRTIRKSRSGLWSLLKSRMLERLNDHVAECPRCQRRLARVNRVEVALMLIKAEPYQMGLLARANNKAINVLTHSLRFAPKSDLLREAKSDTHRIEKARPIIEKMLNVAACLFVVVMIKTGISHSLSDYQKQGEAVIHNYYARNLDSQMFDEMFPIDSSPT